MAEEPSHDPAHKPTLGSEGEHEEKHIVTLTSSLDLKPFVLLPGQREPMSGLHGQSSLEGAEGIHSCCNSSDLLPKAAAAQSLKGPQF